MVVYRITLSKWAGILRASGFPARWNSKGYFVIYTAGSRALACLENLVHRSGEGLNDTFSVTEISIPESISMITVHANQLTAGWDSLSGQSETQVIGNNWIQVNKSAILIVPSVIIPDEFNYLINPAHSDFSKIEVTSVSPFRFDQRLKS